MKWFMRPWISNYEAIVGVAGDVIQLIHSYSFFNLSPVLPCLFSPLCNILFQPVFPYLLSLPLTFVTLCITLSLHHCPFLFLLLSFPFFIFIFLFLDKHIFPQSCLCFVNQLSWLHSSLSFSPSLYLPTRLVITSSTVELMAQFREGKKKKKKEESCSPFIRNGIKRHTRDRLLLSCICAVHMHTCGRMHANTHMYSMHACMHAEWAAEVRREQLKWKESTMRREGGVRESSKYKPRKTPVVWFSQSSRRRNALGCSVMHAPSNYLQPYQEELGEWVISKWHAAFKSSQINTLAEW